MARNILQSSWKSYLETVHLSRSIIIGHLWHTIGHAIEVEYLNQLEVNSDRYGLDTKLVKYHIVYNISENQILGCAKFSIGLMLIPFSFKRDEFSRNVERLPTPKSIGYSIVAAYDIIK